ncbi:putative short-chain dehydrogenases/reductase [Aspergillus steynii IBT 23096]|uniref:Putative short-chain dehydrogenases/reductase n=1 Tax=Aspergillus steynii IBT 23096 TaxID=1392250 RepID=A0A2I2G8A8_9EURO|nr:putative short-chain dehydrogenases/reductase [Aspergillus steynii IBT 23096]PLB49112.1 putative short-chain dehydrogenases/reductase [Aspergillus steynii IBT 23096]
MAKLDQVRASNAAINSHKPELVAVFVGATSGIGEGTAKELANTVKKPTIHLIGRNEATGSKILEELRAANPEGSFHFIKSDVSLLKNVDKACAEIKEKEESIDLLFMSTGYMGFSKNDTPEGLENNHALRYYSRMRFIYNLLPLLRASKGPARVISVLGGGQEGSISEDNLDLQKKWTFMASLTYASTMNSLATEYLAAQNPSVSFIHMFPGVVRTPLMSNTFGNLAGSVMGFLSTPISMTPQESGQRNLYMATSAAYPAAKAGTATGVPLVGGAEISNASTGSVGGGSYILNYDGSDATNRKLMDGYREKQFPRKIWEHTLATFGKALDPAE